MNLTLSETPKTSFLATSPIFISILLPFSGPLTALMMLDTAAYTEISKIIQNFQQKNFIQKKGAYRVGICLALSGPSIWYGRMQPYLNEIELHEHYYIQGPVGCEGEAIQLCAVIGKNQSSSQGSHKLWKSWKTWKITK